VFGLNGIEPIHLAYQANILPLNYKPIKIFYLIILL
jgi:hypothetical protein